MKYKMIALDLDGTLTNSKKEVSAHTRDVLIDIQKRGLSWRLRQEGRLTEP